MVVDAISFDDNTIENSFGPILNTDQVFVLSDVPFNLALPYGVQVIACYY